MVRLNENRADYGLLTDKEQKVLDQATKILERRFFANKRDIFTRPELVKTYLQTRLTCEEREVFSVMFLDTRHRLIACEDMFYGTIDGASVYTREVVKRALFLNAAALIVAHNHPSGNAEPSQADQRLTQQLRRGLDVLEIRLLDHMVIGCGDVVSFAERGLI